MSPTRTANGDSGDAPTRPTDLSARAWWGVVKRSVREARHDNLTDWAGSLTYYAVLALFPALIVLVALVGLVGQYPETTNALLDIVRRLGPESAVDTFREPITGVVRSKGGAGALLGLGLLAALWSASAYVGAFMPRVERHLRSGGRAPLLEAPSATGGRDPWDGAGGRARGDLDRAHRSRRRSGR